MTPPATISTSELMESAGIRSRKELQAAEDELVRHGLIKIEPQRDGSKKIVLLDPATGGPLWFPQEGKF